MITSTILDFLGLILNWVINLLPHSQGLPNVIETSFQYFFDLALGFQWIFPVETLLQILIYILIVEIALFTWGSLNWLLGKIRGSN